MSKILIIDDSEMSSTQLSKHLISQYFDVVRITTKQNPLEAIAGDIYKVVIIDSTIINDLGYQLCAEIKQHFPQMPIFMLSPIYDTESRIKALKSGAEDLITKPYDFELFVSRLRYIIKIRDDIDVLLTRNKNSDLSALLDSNFDIEKANIILIDDDIAETLYIKGILDNKVASLNIVENISELSDEIISSAHIIIASGYLINNFGVEVCIKLKNDRRFNDKPILLLVQQDDDDLLKEAYKAGINEFIITPINSEIFIIKLNRLLNILNFKRKLLGTLIHELDLAIEDPLTGLYNRRHFDNKTANLISESRQNGAAISIAIADIDKFKAVNDTYGHLVGDQVLVETAKRLKNSAEKKGTVFRFGGEEFIILFEGIAQSEASNLAEAIRQDIEKNKFKITVPPYELNITISLGVTTLLSTDTDMTTLIQRSDQGLYKAKESGRNKVVVV